MIPSCSDPQLLFKCGNLYRYNLFIINIFETTNCDAEVIVNYVILVAKYSIYKARLRKAKPSIVEVKGRLKYMSSIEENIAVQNCDLISYKEKWDKLNSGLENQIV